MYIYQRSDWPTFVWNQENLDILIRKIRYNQGRLIGGMESIGFDFCEEALLETLTKDVIKTSEIEDEILDQSLVRSSVARHLGIEDAATTKIDKNIEGIVEMMLDANLNYSTSLTKERVLKWHSILFPEGKSHFTKITTGNWRKGAVQVVSGHYDKEKVHFEAPEAKNVDHEMCIFLDWLNEKKTIDPLLKAAIAHFWFVTIHPFDDGNGRIGRAIADMLLARSENSSRRFYSLSAQIQMERKHYYAILESTQKGTLDITNWITWFLSCLERSIDGALASLKLVLERSLFWKSLAHIALNERQKKVINRIMDGFDGKLTSTKWAKLTKCSQDTAYRDILDLIEKKILVKNPEGGRNTSYSFLK